MSVVLHYTSGVPVELDHVFILTAPDAPEAASLINFGLHEGPPNHHPGQGTANRRFAFANAMLELLWITDADEAQSPRTRRTQLWERWSARQSTASPFGICVRPGDSGSAVPPFPFWEYRPAYLPPPLSIHIAEAGIEEPMWFCLNFMRRSQREEHFVEHPIGLREITQLTLTTLVPLRSEAAKKIVESGIMNPRIGSRPLLEIEFDNRRRNQQKDFRPELPLVFNF
jgi:hypothetical protein